MRVGWIGFHQEGVDALEAVVLAGHEVAGVMSFTPERAASRSGWVDYGAITEGLGLGLHLVESVNSEGALEILEAWRADVVFVLGWTEIVRPPALHVPTLGMVGAHASLLPEDRGRAPVNWALIRGYERTGNTFMWLSEGVDAGDIIAQRAFEVTPYDTCDTLYRQVAATNCEMALDLLKELEAGRRPGRPQGKSIGGLLPGRRPEDGQIQWSAAADTTHNLIRGVTRPYPGAFSFLDGRQWRVWRSAMLDFDISGAPSGTVVSAVSSTVPESCGQLVTCGRGGLILLEVEDDTGEVMNGPKLCELPWTGRRWLDA